MMARMAVFQLDIILNQDIKEGLYYGDIDGKIASFLTTEKDCEKYIYRPSDIYLVQAKVLLRCKYCQSVSIALSLY
jgi:hypothetical protein